MMPMPLPLLPGWLHTEIWVPKSSSNRGSPCQLLSIYHQYKSCFIKRISPYKTWRVLLKLSQMPFPRIVLFSIKRSISDIYNDLHLLTTIMSCLQHCAISYKVQSSMFRRQKQIDKNYQCICLKSEFLIRWDHRWTSNQSNS